MATHRSRKWSSKIWLRYILLQVPEAALLILILYMIDGWAIDLPSWAFWSTIGIWVAKDVAMYPLVWRSYNPEQSDNVMPLCGAKGIAKERLAPSGYILVRGVLWQARLMTDGPPVDEGDAVRVNGRQGLTLFVEPWQE
jgi:membrane protein implicated in regulation of membrane protease activity